MASFKHLILIAACTVLASTTPSAARESPLNAASTKTGHALLVDGARLCLIVVDSLRAYVNSQPRLLGPGARLAVSPNAKVMPYPADIAEKLGLARAKLDAATSCCRASVDPKQLKTLADSINALSMLTEPWFLQAFKTGAGPAIVLLEMEDVFLADVTDTYFKASWKIGKGAFTMRVHADRSWQRKLDEAGLGERLLAAVIEMENSSGVDLQFNPLIHKFVVITKDGVQQSQAELSIDDYEGLDAQDRTQVYDDVKTVYDGANARFVVLFAQPLPAPEQWRRIVFDNVLGGSSSEQSLPKGNLKP